MSTTHHDLARRLLRHQWAALTPVEQQVIQSVLARLEGPRDVNADLAQARTVGERAADAIAAFGGSWPFLGLCSLLLATWVVTNVLVLARPFDPYPFVFLNLILSMLAAVQAPIIMMSQNRQADRDRREAANDYAVNLKAELEIRLLRERLEELATELRGLRAGPAAD